MASMQTVFEMEFTPGVWTDVTADVMHNPPPTWNKGIMGNGPLDRVGSAGIMTFYMKNGQDNSAKTRGLYSPSGASARSGFAPGIGVRMSHVFDGHAPFYKYKGKIKPEGINADVNTKGPRRTLVVCHDFQSQSADHELVGLTLAENKKLNEVITLILANMVVQPSNTDFDAGESTFPTVFDTTRSGARALSEMQAAALSEFGYVYEIGDRTDGSTLRVESRNTRSTITSPQAIPLGSNQSGALLKQDGGFLLKEDGGKLLLNQTGTASFDNVMSGQTRVSHGRHLANRIRATSYPREVDADATTVLTTLQTVLELAAGEIKEGYRLTYHDPDGGASQVNGRDMEPPVSSTDYLANAQADAGGADLTADLSVTAVYGTTEVTYRLENTGASTIFITKLQSRGKGIYTYDTVESVFEDSVSQGKHGVQDLRFDMRYQDDPVVVDAFSSFTLGQYKDPTSRFDSVPIMVNKDSATLLGYLYCEPGTRAAFKEDQTEQDSDYFIQGYTAQLIAGKFVLWAPILKSTAESSFWVWDVSQWDLSTTWGFPSG